jgi:uncharacterized protein YecT (DUF1311 family)
MKWFLCSLLFHLELRTLPAQSPQSDQSKAQAALHSQVSQIGKDCPNAKNTVEENSCIATVLQQTNSDFAVYYGRLRSLLRQSGEAAQQLDESQEEWEHYAQKACDAIDSFYREGTIRTSAVASCRIQLRRSRMRDLDALYYMPLHH